MALLGYRRRLAEILLAIADIEAELTALQDGLGKSTSGQTSLIY
jgi:hypothetical protein